MDNPKYENQSGRKRYIVCAANRFAHEALKKPIMLVGARHYDALMHNQLDFIDPSLQEFVKPRYCEQGFVDQFGCFWSREDAMAIAKTNGQPIDMKRNGQPPHKLFSGGLY